MKIAIEFNTDNDGFKSNLRNELDYIFEQINDKTWNPIWINREANLKILDTNGNTIGTIKITK